jgi:hypothetical protein
MRRGRGGGGPRGGRPWWRGRRVVMGIGEAAMSEKRRLVSFCRREDMTRWAQWASSFKFQPS